MKQLELGFAPMERLAVVFVPQAPQVSSQGGTLGLHSSLGESTVLALRVPVDPTSEPPGELVTQDRATLGSLR